MQKVITKIPLDMCTVLDLKKMLNKFDDSIVLLVIDNESWPSVMSLDVSNLRPAKYDYTEKSIWDPNENNLILDAVILDPLYG